MQRVTLKQVSETAQVSVATASLILSGKDSQRFTPETIDKVRSTAERLGYRTNRLARSLRAQNTRLLGMLSIQVATTPYAGDMLRGAQKAARDRDYDLLFIEVENNLDSLAEGFSILEDHQVDGVVIASFFHQEVELPLLRPANLVLADAVATTHDVDAFVPDEYTSFMQGLDLLGVGHHRIVGYIGDSNDIPAVRGRETAFKDAAAKYGWQDPEQLMIRVLDTDSIKGFEAFNELYENRPTVTAVAVYNDRLALGVYQAIRELGLSVPEDISVTSFDDQRLISEALRPGLTTVALPHLEMGRSAVEKLIERCESSDEIPPEEVAIVGELVVRQSVRSL